MSMYNATLKTELAKPERELRSLPDQLEIKAGIIEQGEKVAFGSDTMLMRIAANNLRCLESDIVIAKNIIKTLVYHLSVCTDGYGERIEALKNAKNYLNKGDEEGMSKE